MAAVLLTGCGASFPGMTEEEADAISEYAAVTLLKYDANARSRLVDLALLEEQAAPKPEIVPEPQPEQKTPEVSDVPVVDISSEGEMSAGSMEDFLEFPEGVSLTFAEYEVCQSYQEGDNQYFALEATEGKSLLVVRFVLQNLSGQEQKLDLLGRRDVYRITVNGSSTRTALTTMLDNDLSSYVGTLEAGATENVVLLIELGADELKNVDSISLNLKNELNTYTIQLL